MGMGVAAFRIAGACRMALVGFGFALRVVVRPVQAEMSYLHTFTHAHSNFTGLENSVPKPLSSDSGCFQAVRGWAVVPRVSKNIWIVYAWV